MSIVLVIVFLFLAALIIIVGIGIIIAMIAAVVAACIGIWQGFREAFGKKKDEVQIQTKTVQTPDSSVEKAPGERIWRSPPDGAPDREDEGLH